MKIYILAISLLISSYLSATTYTASNTNDSGAGSLREAIANATVAGDVVNITATGTITLASTLMVPNAITIQCTNALGIKISGNNAVRVLEIYPETGTAYLKNLHILDALSIGGMGGGIFFTTAVDAGLNMENCTISNCRTQGDEAKGGGIALLGNLVLKNCTLYNNYSEDGGSALDVYDELSYVDIEHCTIVGNVTDGTAAPIYAGGLNLFTSPGVTIKNSIVAGNLHGTTTIKDFTTSPGCVFASQGYNLSTSNLPVSVGSDLQSKDLLTQVKVSALGDYGGGIQTCPLQSGSLAIDAASSAVLLDQRGNSRVGIADIGAYEAPLMPNPTTVAASLVATTTAQLNGTVDTKGASITSYEFQYGTSSNSYTTTVTASTSGTAPNITLTKSLTSLTLGQQYFFRVKVVSSGFTYYSNELSFTTKQAQTITFDALPIDKKYGDSDFALGATAPGGTVTYISSDNTIATISGSNLHIVKAGGPITITASQAGNATYAAAADVQQSITISKVDLTVTASSASRKYGVANPVFTVGYSGFISGESAANLTTQPTASTAAVANTALGDYDVVASGGVSANYEFAYVKGTLTITAADLDIKANDKSKDYGDANPTFDYTYTGFISGESAANLTTLPTASTTATANSPVNGYAITPSGAAAANYAITYTNGTLTVNKVPLLITADDKARNVGAANPAFTFTYSGFVAGDDASDLLTQPSAICAATELSPAGDYTITPSGATSNNYTISVANGTLTVSVVTRVDELSTTAVQISPNPSTGLFKIEGVDEGVQLSVVVRDITGNVITSINDKVVDLTSKANGIYIVSVNANGVTKVFKVVKK